MPTWLLRISEAVTRLGQSSKEINIAKTRTRGKTWDIKTKLELVSIYDLNEKKRKMKLFCLAVVKFSSLNLILCDL